jgi:hypothetical protein
MSQLNVEQVGALMDLVLFWMFVRPKVEGLLGQTTMDRINSMWHNGTALPEREAVTTGADSLLLPLFSGIM